MLSLVRWLHLHVPTRYWLTSVHQTSQEFSNPTWIQLAKTPSKWRQETWLLGSPLTEILQWRSLSDLVSGIPMSMELYKKRVLVWEMWDSSMDLGYASTQLSWTEDSQAQKIILPISFLTNWNLHLVAPREWQDPARSAQACAQRTWRARSCLAGLGNDRTQVAWWR